MTTVLGRRALNRATLARQLLLARTDRPVAEVVEHLVGLQAQTPHSWYIGLWCRIAGFRTDDAAAGLTGRTLVRMALMRSTIHLVTARDAAALRPLVQPVLDRDLFGNQLHGKPVRGLDVDAVAEVARQLLAERALTPGDLGALLHERWPDRPAASLAYAVRNRVPLVQVPPRGLWGRSGPIAHTTAEAWLGEQAAGCTPADLVRRYLGAFGPATVKDAQTWSGLTHLREVVDAIRSELVVAADEEGRELFDLPDAPRPDPETPAPPRLLYDFDNLLLSHADRTRVVTPEFRELSFRPHGPMPSALLLDGLTSGDWAIERAAGTATLTVRTYRPPPDEQAVAAEAAALLAVVAADAERHEVQVRTVPGGAGRGGARGR